MSTSKKKKILSYFAAMLPILFIINCLQLVRSSQLRAANTDRSNGSPLLTTQHASAQSYDHVVASKELRGDKYPASGAGYLGIGYDLYKGNPEGDPTARTMVDPGFRLGVVDGEYSQEYLTTGMNKLRPKYGFSIRETACQMAKETTSETTMSSYSKSLKVDAALDVGVKKGGASGAFGASGGYENFAKTVANNKVERFVMKSYCLTRHSGLDVRMPLKTHTAFNSRVTNLKKKDDEEFVEDEWNEFFNDYGTHFISDVHYGGKMQNMMFMKSSDVSNLKKTGWNAAMSMGGGGGGVSASVSVSTSNNKDAEEKASKTEKCFQQLSLGGTPHETFSDWAATVPDSPMPVKYKFSQFNVLQVMKKNNLVETYNYMLNKREQYVRDVIMGGLEKQPVDPSLKLRNDILLPGKRKCSQPGATATQNGGSCGILGAKPPPTASISAGEGDVTKRLSIGGDGNLRITANYGEDDTVWDNGLALDDKGMYCVEYTTENNLAVYAVDKTKHEPVWESHTHNCVGYEPALTRLAVNGALEVWGLGKSGQVELLWYADDESPAEGISRCPVKMGYCADYGKWIQERSKVQHDLDTRVGLSKKQKKNRRNEIDDLTNKINECDKQNQEKSEENRGMNDLVNKREQISKATVLSIITNSGELKERMMQLKKAARYLTADKQKAFVQELQKGNNLYEAHVSALSGCASVSDLSAASIYNKYTVYPNSYYVGKEVLHDYKEQPIDMKGCMELCDVDIACTGGTWFPHNNNYIGGCRLGKGLQQIEDVVKDKKACAKYAVAYYGQIAGFTQEGHYLKLDNPMVLEGSWNHVPKGCSVEKKQNHFKIHWNTHSDPTKVRSEYIPVKNRWGIIKINKAEIAFLRNDNLQRAGAESGSKTDGTFWGCVNYQSNLKKVMEYYKCLGWTRKASVRRRLLGLSALRIRNAMRLGMTCKGMSDGQKDDRRNNIFNYDTKLKACETWERGTWRRNTMAAMEGNCYKKNYPDLKSKTLTQALSHYTQSGSKEGKSFGCANPPNFLYLGCFKPDSSFTRRFGFVPTRFSCQQNCYNANYKYFALQNFDQCLCGNTYGTYGKCTEPDACAVSGKQSGSYKSSCVFATKNNGEKHNAITLETPSPVGCYNDVGKDFMSLLPTFKTVGSDKLKANSDADKVLCQVGCSKLEVKYFSLLGQSCYCGNFYGKNGACNYKKTCDGPEIQNCIFTVKTIKKDEKHEATEGIDCKCTNGTPIEEKKACHKGLPDKCKNCKDGFFLNADKICEAMVPCTCKHGIAKAGNACRPDNTELCSQCTKKNFHISGGKCQIQVVDFGTCVQKKLDLYGSDADFNKLTKRQKGIASDCCERSARGQPHCGYGRAGASTGCTGSLKTQTGWKYYCYDNN